MKSSLIKPLVLLTLVAALAGCGKKEIAAEPKAEASAKHENNIVNLTKENLARVTVTTEVVARGNLGMTLKAVGRVGENLNKTAKVMSTLEGRLSKLTADLNDPVKVDDVLGLVQTPELLGKPLELKAPIEALKSKVVGSSEGPIEGDRKVCRVKECSMGNLVADATLARVKDQGVTIAFANSGGLRSSIDAGDVSMGEVLTVLPFQNTVATFQLKGEDIRAALENGVSQIDDGAGRFMQVSGLKYSFDRSKPAGGRVVSVEVKEGDAFVPLDPAKTYIVAANNYVRTGGDGFKVFATKAINAYDFGPNLEEAVAAYITANSPYKPYTDGRISEVTPAGYVAPAKPAAPAPAATAPAPAATPAPAAPAATAPAATAPAATAPATATPAAAAAAASKYVVEKGDSLWKIAAEKYGDGALWSRIAKANTLKHPNHIEIGEELELPAQ